MIIIKLSNISAVQKFVSVTEKLHSDVKVSSEGYTVDGKSILELFSLDLSKPLYIDFIEKERNELQFFLDLLKSSNIYIDE